MVADPPVGIVEVVFDKISLLKMAMEKNSVDELFKNFPIALAEIQSEITTVSALLKLSSVEEDPERSNRHPLMKRRPPVAFKLKALPSLSGLM